MALAADIASMEMFNTEILNTPGVLQVVECYSDWAGPCKAVIGTLKALYFSHSDRPIKFYTVSPDKVKEKVLEPYKNKCQPVFLLFKGGVLRHTVLGVRGPDLVQYILKLSDPSSCD